MRTMVPTMRPMHAPMTIAGMNRPDGTAVPDATTNSTKYVDNAPNRFNTCGARHSRSAQDKAERAHRLVGCAVRAEVEWVDFRALREQQLRTLPVPNRACPGVRQPHREQAVGRPAKKVRIVRDEQRDESHDRDLGDATVNASSHHSGEHNHATSSNWYCLSHVCFLSLAR